MTTFFCNIMNNRVNPFTLELHKIILKRITASSGLCHYTWDYFYNKSFFIAIMSTLGLSFPCCTKAKNFFALFEISLIRFLSPIM